MSSSYEFTSNISPRAYFVPFTMTVREIRMLLGFLNSKPGFVLQHPLLIGLISWLESRKEGNMDDTVQFTLSLRQWETLMLASSTWVATSGANLWPQAKILQTRLRETELSVRVAESVLDTGQ